MTLSFFILAVASLGWWAWESARRKRHPVSGGIHSEIELPHEQDFELYHNALSFCAMKTRVCLAELGIVYKSHHIDLIETGAYENIRAAFLAINPAGTVPVLVHNGHPVYESDRQIHYAAEHAPRTSAESPRLGLEDPALHDEMERWIALATLTDDPLNEGDASAGNTIPGLTLPLFAAMIDRVPYWKILEGLLFHFDKLRPFVFLTFKTAGLARFGRIRPAMKLLAQSRRQMGVHLDGLEKKLVESGGPWILGEKFSLADVAWLVIFERLVQADCLHVFVGETRRPECAGYWARLQARPAYGEAILAHAHPTIAHGTRRLREGKAANPSLRMALEGA